MHCSRNVTAVEPINDGDFSYMEAVMMPMMWMAPSPESDMLGGEDKCGGKESLKEWFSEQSVNKTVS